MAEDKSLFVLASIVGIVAVVGLVVMLVGGKSESASGYTVFNERYGVEDPYSDTKSENLFYQNENQVFADVDASGMTCQEAAEEYFTKENFPDAVNIYVPECVGCYDNDNVAVAWDSTAAKTCEVTARVHETPDYIG